MDKGLKLAHVAALVGDPARATMLSALMDGRALTASELAYHSGLAPQTASGHLAKLSEASLLALEKQGRHRYFKLASADVARMLEGILGNRPGRNGPRAHALARGRGVAKRAELLRSHGGPGGRQPRG